jgi:hypothetical protein
MQMEMPKAASCATGSEAAREIFCLRRSIGGGAGAGLKQIFFQIF